MIILEFKKKLEAISQKDIALEKLLKLPPIHEPDGRKAFSILPLFKPVKQTPYDKLLAYDNNNALKVLICKAKPEPLTFTKVIATQPYIVASKVRFILENYDEDQQRDYPIIIEYNNNKFIHDGHHRLSALKLLNINNTKVKLINLDHLTI